MCAGGGHGTRVDSAANPDCLEPQCQVLPPSEADRSSTSSPNLILVLVCLAQFMVVLDATITNVALPSIQKALNFAPADLQWVINIYTLTFGGFLLLGGRAGDLFGRKKLFIIGVTLFTTASLLVGLATSPGLLIAARAVQGLGGALVSPVALSIITTTFAEGRERTRALAVWTTIAVGGAAVGLILGGVLTQTLDWRWNFFINVPVGVATILLALRFVPESKSPGTGGFDLPGALTVTSGLIVLVYAIVGTTEHGWTSGRTLGLLALSIALLAAFVVIEQRTASPLVRLGIFHTRSLVGANLAMLSVAGGMFAIFFFATLYVQIVLGFSPIQAGLGFLPVTVGIMISSVASQKLIPRFGVLPLVLFGLAVAAAGLVLLSFISVDGTYLSDVFPGLFVMALGLGFVFVPTTLIATTNISADDAGLASGLFNSSQQIGGALGLSILATLAATTTTNWLADNPAADPATAQFEALVAGYSKSISRRGRTHGDRRDRDPHVRAYP